MADARRRQDRPNNTHTEAPPPRERVGDERRVSEPRRRAAGGLFVVAAFCQSICWLACVVVGCLDDLKKKEAQ
jgi:hypothetical protein